MKRISDESSTWRTQRRMSSILQRNRLSKYTAYVLYDETRLSFYLRVVYKFRCLSLREKKASHGKITLVNKIELFFLSHER